MVGLLLGNRGSAPIKDGLAPLDIAFNQGRTGTAEVLLSKGADINQTTTKGSTPLYTTCVQGHTGTAKGLLGKGAGINHATLAPLDVPCFHCHTGLVELLLGSGADFNQVDKDGGTPLHTACCRCQRRMDRAALLIAKGADINIDVSPATLPSAVMASQETTHSGIVRRALLTTQLERTGRCANCGTHTH